MKSFAYLKTPTLRYPVLVHCLSGKDRTGIVIAALLLICGVDRAVIAEEYLLSDGEVDEALINRALNGMENLEAYFHTLDLALVRKNLIGGEMMDDKF